MVWFWAYVIDDVFHFQFTDSTEERKRERENEGGVGGWFLSSLNEIFGFLFSRFAHSKFDVSNILATAVARILNIVVKFHSTLGYLKMDSNF